MATRFLHIGGLVAAGFDHSGRYLLVISHNGRGVFDAVNFERVARHPDLAYPQDGVAIGIGPIEGEAVPIVEMNFDDGQFELQSPDGGLLLHCESDGITIVPVLDQR